MKRVLRRIGNEYYYFVDGKRIVCSPEGITGDLSDITGNLSSITGDLSGITGNLSGITGDLSGITGDLWDAQITDADRAAGIHVNDLIAE